MSLSNICNELLYLSNNKYKLHRLIGEGAFCKVYTCTNLLLNDDDFVVKVYNYYEKNNAINELNIFNKIAKHRNDFNKINIRTSSNNIINFYDYYFSDYYIFIIYERAHIDLETFIIKFSKHFNSRIPLFLINKIVKDILHGIVELNYNNIIHCDLKLNNILIKFYTVKSIEEFFSLFVSNKLSKSQEITIASSFSAKLIDLNKSTFINHIHKPLSIQTIEYQAPEIVFGNINYNQTVDVWSVGVIIWILITGFPLIDVDNEQAKYYPFYKNYNLENVIDVENISDMNSQCDDSFNYEDDYYHNYIYLTKLTHMIGPCDKRFLHGKHINTYYKNNTLLGLCNVNMIVNPDSIKQVFLNEVGNFKFFEDNIPQKLEYISLILTNNVFIYDFSKRMNAHYLYNILNQY